MSFWNSGPMPMPMGTYNPNMLYPSQPLLAPQQPVYVYRTSHRSHSHSHSHSRRHRSRARSYSSSRSSSRDRDRDRDRSRSRSHSVAPAPLQRQPPMMPQMMPQMAPQIYHVPGHIRPETLPPNAQVVHLSGHHHHRRHRSHGHERDPRQEIMVQPPPHVQPQPPPAPANYQLPSDGFLDGDHERYSRYPQVVHSEPPQHQPESRQRPYPRDDEYERRHGHQGYYGDRHDDRPRPQSEFASNHSHYGGGHQSQQQQHSQQQDSHSPRPSSMSFRPSHNGSAGGLGDMAANFASGVLNNYVQGHSPRPHSFHNSSRPNNRPYPAGGGSGVYQGGAGGTEHAPPPGQLGFGDIAAAFQGGSATGNLEAMGQAIVDAYRYSRCTGRKKAVCIGINYIGSSNELKGCINDAWRVRDFLVDSHGFKAQDILMLTDDAPDPSIDTRSMTNSRSRSKTSGSRDLSRSQFRALNSRSKVQTPTRENILQAMKWLVGSPKQDDSLFFHYSGHGGRTPDVHGDEADGYDEGESIPLYFHLTSSRAVTLGQFSTRTYGTARIVFPGWTTFPRGYNGEGEEEAGMCWRHCGSSSLRYYGVSFSDLHPLLTALHHAMTSNDDP
ncbi:Ca(2+)-dependent cysteine protease [Pleurotus ostreatus]|uniref:Ca(2+)-dependent cysteine protease n=1 Tax=Pleurotus ostreatus TaxID=5322 RepID=A0A8H6ZK58_PLEOS|nr:Ca(2+)-dependent cysteine protease [Pleurotus ostreatus]KAF7419472.1 Ca(2+)-dependent cysteine protease [Pleurotus ostreatus]